MNDKNAGYQLLYYSSHPEDGEWVCVGLLVSDRGFVQFEFDESLRKLGAIAREQDLAYVRVVQQEFRKSGSISDARTLAGRLAPQFKLSNERSLMLAPSAATIERLRRRFLLRWRPESPSKSNSAGDVIRSRIQDLIARSVPVSQSRIRLGARPSQILGAALAQRFLIPREVSVALVARTRAVIFDGIDSSIGSPAAFVARTNRIAFNFWQYRNAYNSAAVPADAPTTVIKVGLIFDGSPRSAALVQYASTEFGQKSDYTVVSPGNVISAELISEIRKVAEDEPAKP